MYIVELAKVFAELFVLIIAMMMGSLITLVYQDVMKGKK